MPAENPLHENGKKEIKPSTPVNVPKLGRALKKHPNRCFVNYLLTSLVQGFLAGLLHLPAVSFTCKNVLSPKKEPEMVDAVG